MERQVTPSNLCSFNSKLVRLKAGVVASGDGFGFSFQFQTGAIKSREAGEDLIVRLRPFQFQTGAIKRLWIITGYGETRYCFNSKLVRLKVIIDPPVMPAVNSFNSKLVRLKGPYPDEQAYVDVCRFNSKLVRLKASLGYDPNEVETYVSIPNWCD